jgi:NAD(P)-dependent dehydrogenase (short-subunit alcohol dehydrogenase family)/carbon monoxide dehydrogenase subunit G
MDIRHLIDDALEVTVIGSFSRIGFAVRRRLFDWSPPPPHALRGATALVTGPTSGIGRAATDALAALGARIILVGRSRDRLSAVRDALVAEHGEDRFAVIEADMASLASVRAAVEQILATESRLDILVDNAGAIHPTWTESPDGIEATLATMVVGPFALVAGLLPLLRATRGARVIAVTSGGMYAQRLDLDDLETTEGAFDGTRAYARSKRAQVALMREWARRIDSTDVTFNAMHPGWADTPGLSSALPGFRRLMRPLLRSASEGADTIVWLAADPSVAGATGHLYLDRRRRPFDRVPSTRLSPRDRRRLWDQVVAVAGVADPLPDPHPPTQATTPSRRTAMTRIHERIETTMPIDAAFDYVADFANAQEWDPGVAFARRLDDGPLGPGARFELGVRMGRRVAPMEYRVTVFERPDRVVLTGSGSSVDAVDDIRFERTADGTLIDYTADIRLGGLLRLGQPFLGGAFERIGREAAAGMARTLAVRAGRAADPAGSAA